MISFFLLKFSFDLQEENFKLKRVTLKINILMFSLQVILNFNKGGIGHDSPRLIIIPALQ